MNAPEDFGGGIKEVALALQGGGSHGAFTWGVLDLLLEDGRLSFEGISGTSAGAMNAVVLADGLMLGGKRAAREKLRDFWKTVSDRSRFTPMQRTPLDIIMGNWSLDASPGYNFLDWLSKFVSPYDLNPLNLNPLKDLLEELIDFERVRACEKPLVFISCTNVETGRVKVFQRGMISAEAVMASASLPFLFHAVEIDGVPYWDGGYMGNPVLFPFHEFTRTLDYVIVQVNPVFRKGAPKTAREILNRVNEIGFNASLLQELRAIDFARRLLEQGKLDPKAYKKVNVHIISNDDVLVPLGASSKFNAEWAFLEYLYEAGRETAAKWLDRVYPMLGAGPTANTRELYYGDGPDPKPRRAAE